MIVAVGVVLRVMAIFGVSHAPEGDELAYKSMALNLISGPGIVDGMGNHAMYSVGYPLFILAPVFFFFGEDLLVARIANVLLGGGAIVLCYLVAKEAGAGRLGRFMAAAIWAIYLPGNVYAVYLAKENLMIPFMLGVVWCALRLARRPSRAVAVGCGVLLGLLALTGNAALSLLPVVILALFVLPKEIAHRVSMMLLISAAAAMVATPWMVRNMHVIGAPVLNTNGGFNLYLGNNPSATGWFVSIADTPRGRTWESLRAEGEVQASEVLKQEAIAWARAHPSEFMILALKKAAYFWTPPVHDGKVAASLAERVVRALWALQFVLLVVAAPCGFLFRREGKLQFTLLFLGVVCYTAVHMLFYVIFRYREPIMPIVGVMAALAVESFIADRASREYIAAKV